MGEPPSLFHDATMVTYKRLSGSDLEQFRDLNLVFADAFQDQDTHLSRKPGDAYLRSLLSQKHFVALAAFSGGLVVGGLVAYLLEKYEQERSELYLYDLAVSEPFRRQGIARELIMHLRGMAKDMKAWVIFVQADRVDLPAIKLYESLGLREEPFHFDIPVA
jgi:aminoglycoside 3-N-acetyltransferase I